MFRKKVKKAFTLVELLVVIAILAILATVSVVGYMQFTKRAQQSNDMSLTTQINTVLQADEVTGKPQTMTEAVAVMEEAGANIAELSPTTEGYSYVWNSKTNRVILLDENKKVVAPEGAEIGNTADCYAIIKKEADLATWKGYSLYFTEDYTGLTEYALPETDPLVSVDVGTSAIKKLSIAAADAENGTATIYTTEGSTVTIDAPAATINHYGAANNVTVTAVDPINSYHLYGTVELEITVKVGHIVIEAGASVSAVLVDGNDVSIKVESNATLSAVGATQTNYKNVTIDANVTYDVIVGNANAALYFSGGMGTVESPYLISNTRDFLNINNVSSNVYYELTEDINLSGLNYSLDVYGDPYYVYALNNVHFDGDGHSITAGNVYIFDEVNDSEVKNVIAVLNNKSFVANATNSTFDTVTTKGSMTTMDRNQGAFVVYAVPRNDEGANTRSVTLTFKNCVNETNMNAPGTASNYNSIFVGYAYPAYTYEDTGTTLITYTTLNFENCINKGTLVSGKAAMFLGNNSANQGTVTINVTNCSNEGEIRSTYIAENYEWNHYIATGAGSSSGNNKVVLNGETLSTNLSEPLSEESADNFIQGPNDSMTITENDDKTFTFTKSDLDNVSYYVVTVAVYVKNLGAEGGTQIQYIRERINANVADTGSYTTELKNLSFASLDYAEEHDGVRGELAGNVTVTIDGVEYYLVDNEEWTLENGTTAAQMISVAAYDASGSLLSSAAL